jgi:hypothetical protein
VITQTGNNIGWISPRCDKVNAPSVQQCSCNSSNGNGYGGYLGGALTPNTKCHICGRYVGMDAHLCNVTITNKVSNNGS